MSDHRTAQIVSFVRGQATKADPTGNGPDSVRRRTFRDGRTEFQVSYGHRHCLLDSETVEARFRAGDDLLVGDIQRLMTRIA